MIGEEGYETTGLCRNFIDIVFILGANLPSNHQRVGDWIVPAILFADMDRVGCSSRLFVFVENIDLSNAVDYT